jgi:hypothetical protein
LTENPNLSEFDGIAIATGAESVKLKCESGTIKGSKKIRSGRAMQ